MSEFIRVEIDSAKCVGIGSCGACVQVCPVNIFERQGDRPSIAEQNEDECILCEQCLEACAPDAVSIHRLYDA